MAKYYAPFGKDINDITEEQIREIVFYSDEDYWEKGSGDSSIEISDVNNRIMFFYKKNHGYFIMVHPDYLVPYNENVTIETVNHNVGGEKFQVPSCSFVSREQAFEIIVKFIKDGVVPEKYNWIDMFEIPFDYDDFE